MGHGRALYKFFLRLLMENSQQNFQSQICFDLFILILCFCSTNHSNLNKPQGQDFTLSNNSRLLIYSMFYLLFKLLLHSNSFHIY